MRTAEERLRDKFEVSADGCWIWTANQSKGYGLFWYKGTTRSAHRVAYELLVGPIPEGLQIDHLCRTPLCVNPAHMEPVTQMENFLRGDSPLKRNAGKTHCPHGHEYASRNLYVTGTGARRCKKCLSIRARAYYHARKNEAA